MPTAIIIQRYNLAQGPYPRAHSPLKTFITPRPCQPSTSINRVVSPGDAIFTDRHPAQADENPTRTSPHACPIISQRRTML